MKNKIWTTMLLLLSVILSSCGTADIGYKTSNNVSSGTSVSDGAVADAGWKTAYPSYLNELNKNRTNSEYLYYFYKNIDETDPPELFVITSSVIA